jgi:hypothetical protein
VNARTLDLVVAVIAGFALGLAAAMLLDEVERRESERVTA